MRRRALNAASKIISPQGTFTRLTYIEATGEQYINLGYVVQEDDIIEMYYITDKMAGSDKALFGVVESGIGIWATIYNNNSYVRFGGSASTTVSNARQRYKVVLGKGSAVYDDLNDTPAYAGMPTLPLYLFASNNNDRGVNMYGYCQSSGFKISKADGTIVMDLKPCKRDSDGKIGMFNVVDGRFFVNEGSGEDFLAGNEVRVTEDYELIDAVAFDNDKAFDTGFYGNEKTSIDVLFQRTDTSGSDYLYGCSSGDRLTAYLTSSGTGYWRYGNAYKTLNASTKKMYLAKVTPSSIYLDITGGAISPAAYTTSWTLPLGGSKGTTDTISKSYQGLVYFFRMKHGDELLLDWYPCRRKSDGEEGFWDCVSQKFIEKI